MTDQHAQTKSITGIILKAAQKARKETSSEAEPELIKPIKWPVNCTVGPGLEGAVACESKIGYVNGSKGWLIYRGYNIFDLCAYSTFEEVSYLLLHGKLPTRDELRGFQQALTRYRYLPKTMRLLQSFPVEELNTMAALRMGILFMRQKQTYRDRPGVVRPASAIGTDEDSIPMETAPAGEKHAIYEFKKKAHKRPSRVDRELIPGEGVDACYHLIAGAATITAAIHRIRQGQLPLEPDPELGHAANFLYMMTGRRPTPVEERIMDVSLILHADHGMNASTFASMVVASTLSDIYFSVGAGIAALNGPLHGGANEQVLHMLKEIKDAKKVKAWFKQARAKKRKIMGFGHRVYKAYDPRARVLGPLAKHLTAGDPKTKAMFAIATALEKEVVGTLGKEKKIFPNVDFYSGIVYSALGITPDMFTPIFAVSRVSGWTARVLEYLQTNRIFRPRAMYVGRFDQEYVPIDKRG